MVDEMLKRARDRGRLAGIEKDDADRAADDREQLGELDAADRRNDAAIILEIDAELRIAVPAEVHDLRTVAHQRSRQLGPLEGRRGNDLKGMRIQSRTDLRVDIAQLAIRAQALVDIAQLTIRALVDVRLRAQKKKLDLLSHACSFRRTRGRDFLEHARGGGRRDGEVSGTRGG